MRFFPRTWLQFSLRALLVLFGVAAFVGGLAWFKYRDDRDYEARQWHWLHLGYKLEVEVTPVWLGLHTRYKIVGLWPDTASKYWPKAEHRTFANVDADVELRRLVINVPRLSEAESQSIARLPLLEKLELRCDQSFDPILGQLKHAPRLTHLRLGYCRSIDTTTIQQLNELPVLRELSIDYFDELSANLFQLNIPTLERLDVSFSFCRKIDLTRHGFGKLPRLEWLTAQSCRITEVLGDGSNIPLRVLDLRSNPIQRLPGIARAAPNLEILFLDEGDLNDDLARDLQQLPKLKTIVLAVEHYQPASYERNYERLQSSLPELAAEFNLPLTIEEARWSQHKESPRYTRPAMFSAERPFVEAGK